MADKGDVQILIKAQTQLAQAQREVDGFLRGIQDGAKRSSTQTGLLHTNLSSFVSAHKQSFAALAQGAGIFAGAVAGVATGIVALGTRGAAIADVRDHFDGLTKSAGLASDVLLGKLREGTAGTITNFDLMRGANQALSEGLNLSMDQWGLVANGAKLLADRVGGDTKEAYDQLTAAMASGKTAGLAALGLQIDETKAKERYARQLGINSSELTEHRERLAKNAEILRELAEAQQLAGDQTLDFADKADIAKVAVQNWVDNLSVAIAQSPVLSEGLSGIAGAITDAFGADKQTQVQTLVGYVNRFGLATVDAASYAVEFGRYTVEAFYAVRTGVFTALDAILSFELSFVDMVRALGPVAGAAAEETVKAFTSIDVAGLRGMRDSYRETAKTSSASWDEVSRGADAAQATIAKIRERMVAASKVTIETGAAAAGAGTNFRGLGEDVGTADKAIDTYRKSSREMSVSLELATKNNSSELWVLRNADAITKLADQSALVGEQLPANLQRAFLEAMKVGADEEAKKLAEKIGKDREDAFAKSLERTNKGWLANQAAMTEAAGETLTNLESMELDSVDKRLRIIHREYEAKRAALDTQASNYRAALAQYNADEAAATQASVRDFALGVAARDEEARNGAKSWENEFRRAAGTLATAIDGSFAQMILGAKSFKDGFVDIWNSIKSYFTNLVASLAQTFMNGFLSKISKGLGEGFGGGGGGGGFGNLFQSGLSKAFGGAGASGAAASGVLPSTNIGMGAGAAGLGGAGGGGAAGTSAGLGAGLAGGAAAAGGGIAMGLLGKKIFGGAGWKAGGFGAASGAATGAMIGSIVPGIGTAIGAVVGGIAGALTGWLGKSQVNKKRDEFLAQFGGKGTGVESGFGKLAAELTAATGEAGGGALFQQFLKAKDVNAAKAAVEQIVPVLEAYRQKQEEAAVASAAATAEAQAALDANQKAAAANQEKVQAITASLGDLDKQLADLNASEAPEEVMGVVETQTRARIAAEQDVLNAKLAAAEEEQARLDETAEQLAKDLPDAAKEGVEKINEYLQQVNPLHIRVDFPSKGGEPVELPGAAAGGLFSRPSVRVLAEGGEPELAGPISFMERALAGAMGRLGSPAAAAGPLVIRLVLADGRQLAEVVVPYIPDVVRRYGLA